jgi:hypothetical protein
VRGPIFTALIIALVLVCATAIDSRVKVESAPGPEVLCASPEGSPDASGSCWDDPLDLRTALNIAEPGSEVWLMQGEYRPGDDPHSAFYLPEGAEVIGGFTGSADEPSERSSNPALTILDGHDVHYTVLIVAGVDDASLNGVTIKNGAATLIADEATDLQRRGGGVYVSNSKVTLANVTIANNQARFGGGGMYVDESSAIVLRNVTFQGNRTTHPQSGRGGGLRVREGEADLVDVTFRFNQAIRGGGLFVDGGSVHVQHSLFAENEAADRGGGISVYSGDIELSETRFSHNVAVREGAGLFVSRAGNRTVIADTEFRGNDAGNGGGGAWIQSTEVDIDRVNFTANSSGLGTGGGLYLSNTEARVLNVRLQGNQAFRGGGLSVRSASLEMINGLISGNQASLPDRFVDRDAGRLPSDDPDRENMGSDPWRGVITGEIFSSDYLIDELDESADLAGGGLLAFGDGDVRLINVTISGNGSAGIGAAIYRSGETTLDIVNSIVFHNFVAGTQEDPRDDDLIYNGSDGLDATPLLIESSLIERGCPEQDGVSCRDVSPDDPKFLSKLAPGDLPSTSGDFQLWFTSPAIDAGNSYYLPSDVQHDLDGQDRIVQKRIDSDGFGGNGWLDLGALERQIPVSAPNRSIAFDLRNEAVDISVDIETDLDGRPSGTIDVSTTNWAFDGVVLGRVYTRGDAGTVLIDGEAALNNGALRGFIIEADLSGTTGNVRQFRIWLDTGERTNWHSIGID